MSVNHKELLIKYMTHIKTLEGHTFVDDIINNENFYINNDELREIQDIDDIVNDIVMNL